MSTSERGSVTGSDGIFDAGLDN